jgi:hypothetical protein
MPVFIFNQLAEKEGFEPSELVRVHLISNQAHSATLSLLRILDIYTLITMVSEKYTA